MKDQRHVTPITAERSGFDPPRGRDVGHRYHRASMINDTATMPMPMTVVTAPIMCCTRNIGRKSGGLTADRTE
jgi:hypothetical protein